MFELSFDNAKIFKDCIDALVTLIDEGTFNLTETGVTLRAMDPSQIAMVNLVLPKESFEKYNVSGNEKIAVNLDDLSRITARYRPGETLAIKLDDTNSRLVLTFKGQHTRRFNLPLLDVNATEPKEPKIDFDSTIKMNGSVLKEGLKDAGLVSSHVVLDANTEGFTIESTGDKGRVIIETKKGDDILLEHTVNTDSKAMYPLEYLNDLLKATESGAAVSIEMKSDAPLRVHYPIGQATVTYYLAPRIENV